MVPSKQHVAVGEGEGGFSRFLQRHYICEDTTGDAVDLINSVNSVDSVEL